MSYSPSAKNAMLDRLGELAGFVSLHTGAPGDGGINEVSGGSYARKTASWSAASGGTKVSSGSQTFNVPSGANIQYAGLWSQLSGGTFYGWFDAVNVTFNEAGQYVLAAITLDLNA